MEDVIYDLKRFLSNFISIFTKFALKQLIDFKD